MLFLMTERVKVVERAREDARLFVDAFGTSLDTTLFSWVEQSWSEARQALNLSVSVAEVLRPDYMETMVWECRRLLNKPPQAISFSDLPGGAFFKQVFNDQGETPVVGNRVFKKIGPETARKAGCKTGLYYGDDFYKVVQVPPPGL